MDNLKEELTNLKLQLVNKDRNIFHEKVLALAPAIIIHVHSGLIVHASESVNQMFGYIVNELEGMEVNKLLPDALRSKHSEHLKNYQADPKQRNMGSAHGTALKGLKKHGSQFDVKVSLYPFVEDTEVFALAFIMEI
jgi:PAS domain S-box-containing protein